MGERSVPALEAKTRKYSRMAAEMQVSSSVRQQSLVRESQPAQGFSAGAPKDTSYLWTRRATRCTSVACRIASLEPVTVVRAAWGKKAWIIGLLVAAGPRSCHARAVLISALVRRKHHLVLVFR